MLDCIIVFSSVDIIDTTIDSDYNTLQLVILHLKSVLQLVILPYNTLQLVK